MGKASKRKGQRRQGIGPSRADLERRRGRQAAATTMQQLRDGWAVIEKRRNQARGSWWGGPVQWPAVIPQWTEDSVGDRFFSATWLAGAVWAPVLVDANLPDPTVLAGDPGHWEAAISALFRGLVLDEVPMESPVVSGILTMLAPVVHEELAQADEWVLLEELNAPLFLVGSALSEGTWAILGLDPVDEVLAWLEARMHDALAEAGYTDGPDAKVIAESLVRALFDDYSFDEPGDADTLERLGRNTAGNALLDLIHANQVDPADALRLGLVILVALVNLARTNAGSAPSQLPSRPQITSESQPPS